MTVKELNIVIRAKTDDVERKIKQVKQSVQSINQVTRQVAGSFSKNTQRMQKSASGTLGMLNGLLSLLRTAMSVTVSGVMQTLGAGMQNMAQFSANANGVLSRLSASFLYVRNAIATAFMPILQALEPVITAIADAIARACTWIAQFTAAMFGGATTVTIAKKTQVDYATSLDKTTKAAKGQLAAFDELNVLQQSNIPTVSPEMPKPEDQFETIEIDSGIKNFVDGIKSLWNQFRELPAVKWLEDTFLDALKFAGEQIDKIKEAFETLKPILDAIKDNLDEIIDNIWEFLEPLADNTWENYKNIIDKISDIFIEINRNLATLELKMSEFILAIQKFLKETGLWDFFQSMSIAISNLVFGIIGSVLDWIGQKIEAITMILGGVIDFLTGIFSGDLDKAMEGIKSIFSGLGISMEADKNLVVGIFDSIGKFIGDTAKNIGNFLSTMFENVGNFFSELPGKAGQFLGETYRKLIEWGKDAIEWVKREVPKIIDNIIQWFRNLPQMFEGIWNNVIDFFNKLPEKFNQFGNNIWNSVWNGIAGAFNWVKNGLNDFWSGFLNGLLGGSPPKVTLTPVSKFATGGIVTAPTLGLLGEYPGAFTNPEIAAPQSIMQETFVASLMPLISVLEEGFDRVVQTVDDKELNTYFEGRPLARALKPYLDAENIRVGPPLFSR